MRFEARRVVFRNKAARKAFFKELKAKSGCKTYVQLARRLSLPYGRLKLYAVGARSIAHSELQAFCKVAGINKNRLQIAELDMHKVFQRYSKRGNLEAQRKYGKDWARVTGRQGMKKLRKAMKADPALRKKWRIAVEQSLSQKFGADFYSKMGKLGGPKSIALADPDELRARYRKMFRKSFKKRIRFMGLNFRSKKEVEVAKILAKSALRFKYEPRILGFYPDFVLPNKIVIEVFGFAWGPHIKRTKNKIKALKSMGYKPIVYTYPNIVGYFQKDCEVAIDAKGLCKILGYNRGKFGSARSESLARVKQTDSSP